MKEELMIVFNAPLYNYDSEKQKGSIIQMYAKTMACLGRLYEKMIFENIHPRHGKSNISS